MVINLHNQHLDPLLAFIKRSMVRYGNTPSREERDAIVELFALIEQVKKSAHYKLYLRDIAIDNAARVLCTPRSSSSPPPPNDRSPRKRKKRGRR